MTAQTNVFALLAVAAVAYSKINSAADCPKGLKYGPGPPKSCPPLTDPNHKPSHPAEAWFTKQVFDDLFPKANIGWGPSSCFPYNYESFRLAMRYFPRFAGEKGLNNGYTDRENQQRDLAAFFAHAVQETGENDANLYRVLGKQDADDCFYRGGFFNWFEGGPISSFLNPASPGYSPKDGDTCINAGRYCSEANEITYFWPCGKGKSGAYHKSCYFGRGAIQISYNYNYGQFGRWLKSQNIDADLLTNPNLVMTKTDPPLAVLASLWFYMTPQPPKPAMHDIVMGEWHAGEKNTASGYSGPVFGPTSLVINNECNGEDPTDPGGAGESRRIKAFKWFCKYFGVKVGAEKTLSCGDMPEKLQSIKHSLSMQPDWSATWKDAPCNCAPAPYGGMIPYFQPSYYPGVFVDQNEANREWCVKTLYDNPSMYKIDGQNCLNYKPSGGSTTKKPTKPVTKPTKPVTGTTPKPTPPVTKPTPTKPITRPTRPTPKPTRPTTTSGGDGGSFKCPSDGFHANPKACGKFYQCAGGRAFPHRCPPGLHFNSKLSICDWSQNANCHQ